MKFVKKLNEISNKEMKLSGGKGASLAKMINMNIPVPEGFVILSTAFDYFLKENKIEKLSKKINEANIPKELEEEIIKNFIKLNSKLVAVRSSATAEDSSNAAWAGQLETYLNTDEKNLIKNIKKCWASLYSSRATQYRLEKKIHKKDISVAVVIQKMIQSEVSGVAFSVNPVNQNRNEILIEAALGLGEAIVSGQITPDRYTINKKKLEIIDKKISEQIKKLVGVNRWKNISFNKQKLDDKQIKELSKLILKLERLSKFPVDVEWALDKDKFYILQSRPITTLLKKTLTKKKEHELIFAFREPMPLFWASITEYSDQDHIFLNKNRDTVCYILNKESKKKKISAKEIIKLFNENNNELRNFKLTILEDLKDLISNFETIVRLLKKRSKIYNFTEKIHFKSENYSNLEIQTIAKLRLESKSLTKEKWIILASILKRVSLITKLSMKQIFNHTYEEILDLAKKRYVNEEVLRKRAKHWGLIQEGGKKRFLNDEEIKNFYAEIKKLNNYSQAINGSSVYPGKIIGKVKIILSFTNKNNLASKIKRVPNKKVILVTGMTHPDVIKYIRKFDAIVTDEGGVLCHAGVIAREFRIPCITGTEKATQVLHNGDLVEVDANMGVVRILKKKKS